MSTQEVHFEGFPFASGGLLGMGGIVWKDRYGNFESDDEESDSNNSSDSGEESDDDSPNDSDEDSDDEVEYGISAFGESSKSKKKKTKGKTVPTTKRGRKKKEATKKEEMAVSSAFTSFPIQPVYGGGFPGNQSNFSSPMFQPAQPSPGFVTQPQPSFTNPSQPQPFVGSFSQPQPSPGFVTQPQPSFTNPSQPQPFVGSFSQPQPSPGFVTQPQPSFTNPAQPQLSSGYQNVKSMFMMELGTAPKIVDVNLAYHATLWGTGLPLSEKYRVQSYTRPPPTATQLTSATTSSTSSGPKKARRSPTVTKIKKELIEKLQRIGLPVSQSKTVAEQIVKMAYDGVVYSESKTAELREYARQVGFTG